MSPPAVSGTITTVRDLRRHLQTALQVEHATIPPYLCALYSIREPANRVPAELIRSIVMEEMLHMTLVANLLNAVGGRPRLAYSGFVPAYPAHLPHCGARFKVSLERFSTRALTTFLRIERPEPPRGPPEADRYHSLGQFYDAVAVALEVLSRRHGRALFAGVQTRQVTPEHYYGGLGQPTVVRDLESALGAIEEIKEQGEGLHHGVFDADSGLHGRGREPAHYFRFHEILVGRRYQLGDTPRTGPTGRALAVDWEAVHPMRANPKRRDFPPRSAIRALSDECNRTYGRLLRQVERAYNGEPARLLHAVGAMYELKYQAVALMQIPIGRGGETAGPTFEPAFGARD